MRLNKRQILKATEWLELRHARALAIQRGKAFLASLFALAAGFAGGVAAAVCRPQAFRDAEELAKAVFGG